MVKAPLLLSLQVFLFSVLCSDSDVYAQSPKPSGKISIESTSIALAVGVHWGEGLLSFNGKGNLFAVDGLTLVDVGIATASAVGEVYNLTEVSQFEGTYLPSEAGFDLVGGISMRNKNGVLLHLRGGSEEALLQLDRSGMTIKLRK